MHMFSDLPDGRKLVRGFFISEKVVEFRVHRCVFTECESPGDGPLGIELEKLLGHLHDLFPGLLLCPLPCLAAQLIERRSKTLTCTVFLKSFDALERDINPAVCIFEA